METSKERLQNVLRITLTDTDVEYIKEYWRSFYKAPEDFINDNVVDMIHDDLGKYPIDKNDNGGNTTMTFEEILSSIPDASFTRFIDDGSLAWGKYNGELIYAKRFKLDELAGIEKSSNDVTLSRLAAIVFKGAEDYVVIVIPNNTKVDILPPIGYEKVCVRPLTFLNDRGKFSRDEAMFFAKVFVPFNDGPSGSKLPIIWYSSSNDTFECETMKSVRSLPAELVNAYITADGFALQGVADLSSTIESSYPPVVLTGDRDHDDYERYQSLMTDRENQITFVYNRNHVAYNGNKETLASMLPVVALYIAKDTNIVSSNIEAYVLGKVTQQDVWIEFRNGSVATNNVDAEPTVSTSEAKPVDDKQYKKLSDNPMIAAAQMADKDYR
jgi:hypothetical protein